MRDSKNIDKFGLELRNRRYANNTIRLYTSAIRKFFEFARKNTALSPENRIACFLDGYANNEEAKRLAWCAVLSFYRVVVNKPCPYRLTDIRSRKRLPVVLSKEEIATITNSIRNDKHKTMILLLYGSGLRVSEAINLKCASISFTQKTIRIMNAKQHKDRITLLPAVLIPDLQAMCDGKRPNDFVFTTISGSKYSVRTLQTIFSKALRECGIQSNATCHSLRHSFATHLLEQGVHLGKIKSMLGHSSLKTTMIYLHTANDGIGSIPSPLDV